MSSNLANIVKKQKKLRKAWKASQNDLIVLEQFYTKCSAAYGSINKLKRNKTIEFFADKNAHTKCRQIRRNFLPLKVMAHDINEIWLIDVAYEDKLAQYNNCVKYLLVTVDVLSRFVTNEIKDRRGNCSYLQKMIQNESL